MPVDFVQEQVSREADGRFRKGLSGNPKGRPMGARNKATEAAELVLDGEAEALTRKAVELALEGEASALRLCLERIIPPRRERPVKLTVPSVRGAADLADTMAAITTAATQGTITPGQAAELARRSAAGRLAPKSSPAARTPTNVSPAPVVSTGSIASAGKSSRLPSARNALAPAAPRVTTNPCRSQRAIPIGLDDNVAASISFATRRSISGNSARSIGSAGARLSRHRPQCLRTRLISAWVSRGGTSSWATRVVLASSKSSGTQSHRTPILAPGATAIMFSPPADTMIKAQPVGSSMSRTRRVSTPSPWSEWSAIAAKLSRRRRRRM